MSEPTYRSKIKTLIGQKNIKKIAPLFHGLKGILASVRFRRPANQLCIIAITGTKGKTTTTMQLGRMLNLSGINTGYISTGSIYLGDRESDDILELSKLEEAFTLEKLEEFKNN